MEGRRGEGVNNRGERQLATWHCCCPTCRQGRLEGRGPAATSQVCMHKGRDGHRCHCRASSPTCCCFEIKHSMQTGLLHCKTARIHWYSLVACLAPFLPHFCRPTSHPHTSHTCISHTTAGTGCLPAGPRPQLQCLYALGPCALVLACLSLGLRTSRSRSHAL